MIGIDSGMSRIVSCVCLFFVRWWVIVVMIVMSVSSVVSGMIVIVIWFVVFVVNSGLNISMIVVSGRFMSCD